MPAADTIVAVSSPPGRSARGLIRWAGPDAGSLLARLTDRSAPPPPRQATPLRLAHPDLPPIAALLTWFAAPASYCGDDTAELQLPGHPALLDRVLRAALDAGARPAEPGEFTFRAYTAGRLDLTQAEGVAATIHAVSDGQLAAAAHLRHGELARFSRQRVDRLGQVLALVEAGIDFVDQEDVVPIAPPDLARILEDEASALKQLLGRSRSWGEVEALPRVVLVGPPSAGKSTLFNALLGRPRAVVDPAPGTTRDVLEEPLRLHGPSDPGGGESETVEVMLCDLAGLEDPRDAVQQDVQTHVARAVAGADLILRVRAVDQPETPSSSPPFPPLAAVLELRSKCDHPSSTADPSMSANDDETDPPPVIHVSAHHNTGLDALRAAILQALGQRAVSVQADLLSLQPRHEAALRSALQHLRQARDYVSPDARQLDAIEWVAGEMRLALDQLAGLGGQLTPDDVIGRVFSTFCVGK